MGQTHLDKLDSVPPASRRLPAQSVAMSLPAAPAGITSRSQHRPHGSWPGLGPAPVRPSVQGWLSVPIARDSPYQHDTNGEFLEAGIPLAGSWS